MNEPIVSRSDWSLSGRTISKRFSYHGHYGRWLTQTVFVEIQFNLSRATKIFEPSFSLILKPSPMEDWENGQLDARIVLEDESRELSSNLLINIENTADGQLIVSSNSAKDAAVLVDELCRGKDFLFTIQDGKEVVLKLPIPNDHGVYKLIRRASL